MKFVFGNTNSAVAVSTTNSKRRFEYFAKTETEAESDDARWCTILGKRSMAWRENRASDSAYQTLC